MIGDVNRSWSSDRSLGLRPALLYHLPSKISTRSALRFKNKQELEDKGDELEFAIKEVKDENDEVIYHCMQLGERPKTKASEELSKILERLYHGGELREEIKATGRWYTDNGQKEDYRDFAGIHSPEFEYKGNKYVREISYPDEDSTEMEFSDGTELGKQGTVRWIKVEPVSWIIRNWDEMPTSINQKGNGKAKYFDLIAEEVLTGNIPFYPNEDDVNSTMWQNSMPRGYLNGIDVRNIVKNGSPEHTAARGGNFTGECNFLNETFNLGREPIFEYAIPESETEIVEDAFNGCVTLKKLYIHPQVISIGKRAFEGLAFHYAYNIKSTGELVFAEELPENKEEIENIIDIGKLKKSFIGFDYRGVILEKENLKRLYKFTEILNKNKFSIPAVYGKALIKNGLDEKFYANADFRFFRSEFKDINDVLLDFPEEERLDFFKFANSLGCFSTERILDKKGKETEVFLGQKATTVLATLVKTEKLKIGQYHKLFASMPFEIEPQQEFLKFIALKSKNKFENMELLLTLEEENPGILVKVMSNFENVKTYRDCLDEHGKPIKISWEEALKKYYFSNKYEGVTKENSDIAEFFGKRGLEQSVFDEAVELREEAKENHIPEHLLGESLKEETILQSIERIRSQTEAELVSGKQMIEELYEKQFTYEWLSKNDPRNSIMGLLCSCCGSITSEFYGREIAIASITAEDVQNLVVRNSKGDIISKGTFYLNKEKGYGVINDFELNNIYRKHEDCVDDGIYNVDPDSKEEQEREMIFKAFQRGLQAFVEKYNQKNPEKPIKQINIGTGYNRLKRQIERFREESNNLSVPSDYCFYDAEEGQYVLYEEKAKERDREDGGDER